MSSRPFGSPSTAFAQLNADDEPNQEEWTSRWRELNAEVERLRENLEQMKISWTKMRQRNYPRGAPRDELEANIQQTEREP